ncbi:MAG TPA: hypothetical protein VIL46_02175 [Gemmataceae bacterium]
MLLGQSWEPPGGAGGRPGPCAEAEVVELSVLLPHWQLAALESAAHRHGITAGQMLRRLIGQALAPPGRADLPP